MGAPYVSTTPSSYNANPPADDGSQVAANQVKWSTIKTKLSDPLNTFASAINSVLVTAFGKMLGSAGVTSTGVNYTVQSSDQGKLIRATASSIVITTPDATVVATPFAFSVLNSSSAAITCAGNGSETIDGSATISVPAGAGLTLETDGSNWFTRGQNYIGTQGIPQGRLTLTSATPILAADVTAATSVYYTPYTGNLVPIYNGVLVQMRSFAELTLTLSANSNFAASAIYDIFTFDSSGAVTIGIGPAWTTPTAGSGARGTGAGTTELQRLNGLWTNKVSMTARNGASTYTVAANQGTYLGSLSMDATNGQVSCTVTYGQSRKFGIWNAYNRVPIVLKAGTATASWAYASATIRASNNDAANSLSLFCGLAEEQANVRFLSTVSLAGAGEARNYIGWNSTTVASGFGGRVTPSTSNFGTIAEYDAVPFLGLTTVTALENVSNTAGTWLGTEGNMLLTGRWRG